MEDKLELNNIVGKELKIYIENNQVNSSFLFLSNSGQYKLELQGIQDVVDISHLFAANEIIITINPENDNSMILTVIHQYAVDLNIVSYKLNS